MFAVQLTADSSSVAPFARIFAICAAYRGTPEAFKQKAKRSAAKALRIVG